MHNNNSSNWITSLSPELFWDVDQKNIDPEKHTRWLLERVLERGRWEDWIIIRDNIDNSRMMQEIDYLKITPKTRNFLYRYLHAPHSISK